MNLKSLATHHIKLAGVHRAGFKTGTDLCDRDNTECILGLGEEFIAFKMVSISRRLDA